MHKPVVPDVGTLVVAFPVEFPVTGKMGLSHSKQDVLLVEEREKRIRIHISAGTNSFP